MKHIYLVAILTLSMLTLFACGESADGGGSDATAPVISLKGDTTVGVELGSIYTDPGATATDDIDGDISARITTKGEVDTNTLGSYVVTYEVKDSGGNAAIPVARFVIVVNDLKNASEVVAITEVNGRPAARLLSGDVFILDPVEEWEAYRKQFPVPEENLIDSNSLNKFARRGTNESAARDPLPSSVNLDENQTSLKRQFNRGTCVSHAVLAGIEAAYKRELGLDLDLSEQFANHLQKMVSIIDPDVAPDIRENQLGFWGGSGIIYMLNLLNDKYRLPLGVQHRYIGDYDFEDTRQAGDEPYFDFLNLSLSQSAIDDVNLSNKAIEYRINSGPPLFHESLPDDALINAKYGISNFGYMRSIEIRNLDLYKQLLVDGYEIIVGVTLRNDPLPGNDIKDPDLNGATTGGHAVLIVGYSDEDQAFLVKNSWGSPTYEKWSYAWVTAGLIYEAAIISDIQRDVEEPALDKMMQRFIGQWSLNHDGWRGRLDIYRLPGTYPEIKGQVDRRIGTYFGPDGIARRVNGVIRGEELEFYIDWDNPDPGYEALQGLKFSAHFSGLNYTSYGLFAGTMLDNRSGQTYGFYATRSYHFGSTATSGYFQAIPRTITLSSDSYRGTWAISFIDNFFGQSVQLKISDVDESSSELTAVLFELFSGDNVAAVTGGLEESNRRIRFNIDHDDYEYQRFDGYIFSRELGIFSGTATFKPLAGEEFKRGFIARRADNSSPDVTITSPLDGSSFLRNTQTVNFNADVGDADGDAVSIVWTSNIDGEISTAASFSKNDLSYGLHEISATVTDSKGSERSRLIEVTITNIKPDVLISQPDNNAVFCANENINFKSVVTDLNTLPGSTLSDSAVAWSVLGSPAFATGKDVSHAFAAGNYTINVRATDDEGVYDEARVKIAINDCTASDNPPVVRILDPAADTTTYDDRYAYDGYDDVKGMWYTDVILSGAAIDDEDGSLPGGSLVWQTDRSDLQTQLLGVGKKITVRLYSNNCFGAWHEVSLVATDSDGNSRSALVRIYIWTLC
ncbi:MAG: immunoglobulin-like domain-containing protein [Gammaproteobacteria bacterium]